MLTLLVSLHFYFVSSANPNDFAVSIRIARKMIVDYIEAGFDSDMESWKVHSTAGNKKNQISVFVPSNLKGGQTIKLRYHVPLPKCKLEDALSCITDMSVRSQVYSDSVSNITVKKKLPLSTSQIHVTMKTDWPIGPRDALINQQVVKYQEKAWIVNHSVEDEDTPLVQGCLRTNIQCNMFFLKPTPTIHGYTLIFTSEYTINSTIPFKVLQKGAIKTGVATWLKFQKCTEGEVKKRQQQERD